jgi:hypothetical protein
LLFGQQIQQCFSFGIGGGCARKFLKSLYVLIIVKSVENDDRNGTRAVRSLD